MIAARLGSMEEMIDDGRTGWFAEAGNVSSLTGKLNRVWHRPEVIPGMRVAARAEFESKYTAERNYVLLIGVYNRAIAWHKSASAAQKRTTS